MTASEALERAVSEDAFMLVSDPVVMVMSHTYQKRGEGNTPDDECANRLMHRSRECANIPAPAA